MFQSIVFVCSGAQFIVHKYNNNVSLQCSLSCIMLIIIVLHVYSKCILPDHVLMVNEPILVRIVYYMEHHE